MQTNVRFRLLGPVRVWCGQTEINPAVRQQRMILSLLLARCGAVVSQTEIFDALWGSDPPASAANVVHRSIGHLRRLMEPNLPVRTPGTLLNRVGSGYHLHVTAATFDLLASRGLIQQAQANANPAEAIDLYIRALAWWRGDCAADTRAAFGPLPVFSSIDGERSHAVRDATDLAMRTGQASLVLPALRSAASSRPLDEALQSRLVLALAADGQREAALTVYRSVQQRLADELGIDPGAELRAAADSLTRRDLTTPSTLTLRKPAQLPASHRFFSARPAVIDQALRMLAEQRTDGPATLSITGMPGVGKTTLAVHLAHRLAAACPDGQFFADLRGFGQKPAPMLPIEALRGFLVSLGESPAGLPHDVEALARRFRGLLGDRRVLLVLDNCHSTEQIRDLLPTAAGSVVITATRAESAADGMSLHLTVPNEAEAVELLSCRVGTARVAAEPQAVRQIVKSCGRLPLALALVAARAAAMPDRPLAAIADELVDAGVLAALRSTGADPATAFSWSYRRLTPATARLFRLLPLHPGPDMTTTSLSVLAGASPPVTRLMVGDLLSNSLLEVRDGRLHLHELLHDYARELNAQDPAAEDSAAAATRVFGYYCATAASAYRLIEPGAPVPADWQPAADAASTAFGNRQEAREWLSAEWPSLLNIALGARRHGQSEAALYLATLLQNNLHLAGPAGVARADSHQRSPVLHRRLGETVLALRIDNDDNHAAGYAAAGSHRADEQIRKAIGHIRDGLHAPSSVRESLDKALAVLQATPESLMARH